MGRKAFWGGGGIWDVQIPCKLGRFSVLTRLLVNAMFVNHVRNAFTIAARFSISLPNCATGPSLHA